MPNKKKKKSRTDELFGGSVFGDFDLFEKLGEGKRVEGGYSISVSQTPEGTKVHAKVGKDTEVNELRRQLQQQYPSAQIKIEGGRPLIKEIETKKVEEEDKEA